MAVEHVVFNRSYRSAEEISDRLVVLVGENGGYVKPGTAAAHEWNSLNELRDEMRATQRRVRTATRGAGSTETPEFGQPGFHRERTVDRGTGNAHRDAGLRAVEEQLNSGVMRSDAADSVDSVLRRDASGVDGRYIAAVSSPFYNSGFGKMLAEPTSGHLRFTQEEHAAWSEVQAAEQERASLQTGSGAAGGFALPIAIDPSILLNSNGALNPIRQLARVRTVATTEWRGVSSAGVVASYDAELSEVSDDAPVLAQPVILAETGRAFVPFSIEVGQDWDSIQRELAQLIQDGRDVLDATIFYSGTGTDQPFGLKTGLTTTQRVQTDVAATFDVDDCYDIKGQLPPRFMANATWLAHPTKWDTIFRFTPSGSTTEPQALPTRDGQFIGKPKAEWTSVPTALTTGTTQLLYGDVRAAYTILDRLGMTLELIPHLFGAAVRPTGQRGVFAYWRTGAKCVVPEAMRYLETL
jgi:HK97 family phage major capsid protein